jgi:tetratricopeptide (TPR) repeat protein
VQAQFDNFAFQSLPHHQYTNSQKKNQFQGWRKARDPTLPTGDTKTISTGRRAGPCLPSPCLILVPVRKIPSAKTPTMQITKAPLLTTLVTTLSQRNSHIPEAPTSHRPVGSDGTTGATDPQIAIVRTGDKAPASQKTGPGDPTASTHQNLRLSADSAPEEENRVPEEIEAAFRGISLDETHRTESLRELRTSFVTQFEQTGSMHYLMGAVRAGEESIPLGDSTHLKDDVQSLILQGKLSEECFAKTHSFNDLHNAIVLYGKALCSISKGQSQYLFVLESLGKSVVTRTEYIGLKRDVEVLITLLSDAVVCHKDAPNRRMCFIVLHALSSLRLGRLSEDEVLRVLALGEEIIQSSAEDDPTLPQVFIFHSLALIRLCVFDSSQSCVDRAIEVLQRTLSLIPNDSPYKPLLMPMLTSFLTRRSRNADSIDLNAAVESAEDALELTSDQGTRYFSLNALRSALLERFEKNGLMEDLQKAFDVGKEAVNLIPIAMSRGMSPLNAINGLGDVLKMRFKLTGSLDDLDESISLYKETLKVAPTFKLGFLPDLSEALISRFERTGSLDDLNAAIDASAQATDGIRDNDPNLLFILGTFGNAVYRRFQLTGSGDDLDFAVELFQSLVTLAPSGSIHRPAALLSLSCVLSDRFERTKSIADLDESVRLAEQAMEEAPNNDPNRQKIACHLGLALVSRLSYHGFEAGFDQAIECLQEALDLPINSNTPWIYNNLARAFMAKHDQTKALGDCNAAVDALEKAVELAKDDEPDKSIFLFNLGASLRTRFELTGSSNDFQDAVEAFEKSVQMAFAEIRPRIYSAVFAADLLYSQQRTKEASQMIRRAVHFLPLISSRALRRADRRFNLSNSPIRGLAADASALAIRAGDNISDSLSLLEIGRGIFTNTELEMRGDVNRLRESHPDLADKYIRLGLELNSTSWPLRPQESLRGQLLRGHNLSSEFDNLLFTIREKHGFERFLLGPSRAELNSIASNGPIVILTSSRCGSDAFLITRDDVRHMPLENLQYSDLEAKAKMLLDLLDKFTLRNYAKSNQAMTSVLEWLWDVAVESVLNALGFVDTPRDDTKWPRIWWIPVGLLSLFPVHGAGRYPLEGECKDTVLDRVISSYAPTIRALDHSRHQMKDLKMHQTEQTVLLVSMAETLNQSPLKYAEEEIKIIDDSLPPAIKRITLSQPSKSEVHEALIKCPIVHFACHGMVHSDPSRSSILFADSEFSIAEISQTIAKQAEFAYISTCHAATSRNISLLDESINIAAAFQLTGFPSVIGTLWQLQDEESVTVSKEVYCAMVGKDGRIDSLRSAAALHFAVRQLRRNKWKDSRYKTFDPLTWATYIHVGV